VADDESIPSVEPENPVLGAIIEFRATLNRLFDEQKAFVLSRAGEESEAKADADALPTQAPPIPPQPVAAELPAVTRKPLPVNRSEVTEVAAPAPSPSETAETVSTEAAVGGKPDDPRQRLDALARLLDKRLKQQSTAQASETGVRTAET
jgi:hypothetical protein